MVIDECLFDDLQTSKMAGAAQTAKTTKICEAANSAKTAKKTTKSCEPAVKMMEPVKAETVNPAKNEVEAGEPTKKKKRKSILAFSSAAHRVT